MINKTHIKNFDSEIFNLIKKEKKYQLDSIRLIPSENYSSEAVRFPLSTFLGNKYAEGYPEKRYYEGNENIDKIEKIAILRCKKLFKAENYHVNVQPYSGSPANLAALLTLCNPGDTIMGMTLSHGGHLTHGYKVSITGKIFNSIQYEVNSKTNSLDYDEILKLAKQHKPKVIIAGFTAYPREIDFKKFKEIADSVDAYLLADISHISGLVAAEVHSSPVGYADIITSTSHKTLRGPRGAFILCREELKDRLDKSVFPNLQGGPHEETIAAMAVAFKEASTKEFKKYSEQIIKNSKKLSEELIKLNYKLITGGTDNHLILIDTFSSKNLSGKIVASTLSKVNIICNANTIPFDSRSPFDPSGIRIGTPAITTIGMKENDMIKIAKFIDEAIKNYTDENRLKLIKKEVINFIKKFN